MNVDIVPINHKTVIDNLIKLFYNRNTKESYIEFTANDGMGWSSRLIKIEWEDAIALLAGDTKVVEKYI